MSVDFKLDHGPFNRPAGYDITFLHLNANEQFPIRGEGVLIELVQAPAEVIAAYSKAKD